MKNRRKGGRPLTVPALKKTAQILVKCRLGDKQRIQQMAHERGLPVNEFMVRQSLGRPLRFNPQSLMKQLHELNLELARSGNNLNQLAHYTNTMKQRELYSHEVIHSIDDKLLDYHQHQIEIQRQFQQLIRLLKFG